MGQGSYSILLVEDHPDVAEIMKIMIRMLGHRVAVARSVAESVETVSENDFDLALVDYRLPDGTGVDLLKAISPREPIPAVLLTAYDEGSLDPSMKEGFSKCLRKPVGMEDLQSVIEALCAS